ALPVRRHQHIATAGRRAVRGRRRAKAYAGRADIVAEAAAELVGFELADEGRAAAEPGDADHRIRRRSSRYLDRRAHSVVDRLRPRLVDQRHAAFAHTMRQQKVVIGAGKDIDDGVADAEDVETSGGDGWH